MQSAAPSRKRPAPGASPLSQQQPLPPQQALPQQSAPFQYQPNPENADYANFDFNSLANDQPQVHDVPLMDPSAFAAALDLSQPHQYRPTLTSTTSTDLVRRNPQVPAATNGNAEQWNGFASLNGQQPEEEEDEQALDLKVALAKRDAQGKRKQIPPFVQKLSSFLDSNNTDLIRWSDDGRSFIVLDEDEFARTLIPELFKHNNYASFVRQLNMYGFHKTVNITDGSLRQSEKARKGVKPPSMYSHPYFRKNRPDLLWLIQKPSGRSGKRKRDGNAKDAYDSDDDRQGSPGLDPKPPGEVTVPAASTHDVATIPRTELAGMRNDLKRLQQQQNIISRMIAQLKEQNDQFYRQATAFQALHDRHENSINAILTFLATFYNRSLDGHAGSNLVNMFSNNTTHPPTTQQHGSVVEEFNDTAQDSNNQIQRFVKRPQLLLTAPTASSSPPSRPSADAGSARTSMRPSPSPALPPSRTSLPPTNQSNNAKSASPTVKHEAPTPDYLTTVPENEEMMSLINHVNATTAPSSETNSPAFDFSSALDHYQTANGNAPLTPQQRDDMLALIATQHGQDPSNPNNALISPAPPPMPHLAQLRQNQQQLEILTNMQKRQDAKVQDLHRRLQPLSPTGTIPGLNDEVQNPFDLQGGASADFDPSAFLNFDPWSDHALGSAGDAENPASAAQDLDFDSFAPAPAPQQPSAGNPASASDINWDDFAPAANDPLFPLGDDIADPANSIYANHNVDDTDDSLFADPVDRAPRVQSLSLSDQGPSPPDHGDAQVSSTAAGAGAGAAEMGNGSAKRVRRA